jgi:hypothetical protein
LDKKREWMEKQLRKENSDVVAPAASPFGAPLLFGDAALPLQVHRDRVFQDSFDRLQLRPAKDWKKEFKIQFAGMKLA